MKLHLLDGTYELFRSHFGAPSRKAPDGREVGATHGIIASTLSLLDTAGVTHLGAAFDSVIRSFRNDVFPGYKDGEGIDEDLLAQFALAERALKSIGVVVWSMYEFEADDALATAAVRWAPDVDQVVVCTPDKDMAQLYWDSKVVGYDRRREIFMDAAGVVEKFGVDPKSIPDYLALVGDTADAIPGLRGWGAKSSSIILGYYKTLENIPLEASRWAVKVRGAEKLCLTLRENMGDAVLYRFLATLRYDVPILETLEDLEWKGAHLEHFTKLCDELGFGRLVERPKRWQNPS